MGVVSPIGHEVDEFYNNLLEGRSGISMIEVRQSTWEAVLLVCEGCLPPREMASFFACACQATIIMVLPH
jgi:3-oxoacyl-(acyl-carrier-protein) synthase